MARHAEAAGYDAVWVGDSIVAKPRLEALTTLAYLAGITTRVRLGTAVLLPALRHPVVLGLGVGWSLPSAEREWAACGMDHKRRARRLEEHIETWRMLWRGEPVTYRGDDFELTDHTIGPLPWHDAGPPGRVAAGFADDGEEHVLRNVFGRRRRARHVQREAVDVRTPPTIEGRERLAIPCRHGGDQFLVRLSHRCRFDARYRYSV